MATLLVALDHPAPDDIPNLIQILEEDRNPVSRGADQLLEPLEVGSLHQLEQRLRWGDGNISVASLFILNLSSRTATHKKSLGDRRGEDSPKGTPPVFRTMFLQDEGARIISCPAHQIIYNPLKWLIFLIMTLYWSIA